MRFVALALLAVAGLAAASVAVAEEEPGGNFIALPLDVEVYYPPEGSAFATANITAVVEADGESVAFFSDDFSNGTLVNATRDASGVVPNASAGPGPSNYTSPIFLLPSDAPQLEWSPTLEFLTSGSSANLTLLYRIEARFGDRSDGRNWSSWVPCEVDGSYGSPKGPLDEPLRSMPALQYRFTFLQPQNASNPHLSQMEIWFLVHIAKVEARQGSGAWQALGVTEGRYNFSVTLPPGNSTIEGRVTDGLGGTKTAVANVTLDLVRPTVASAPTPGASVPPDEAASIVFSEPMDRASASVHVRALADFPVDMVWSADNTTLFISAQQSGKRGTVTVVLGAQLRDRVGNELGEEKTYTMVMGKPPESAGDITPLLIAMFAGIGGVAVVVLLLAARAKKRNEAYAKGVIGKLSGKQGPPPAP